MLAPPYYRGGTVSMSYVYACIYTYVNTYKNIQSRQYAHILLPPSKYPDSQQMADAPLKWRRARLPRHAGAKAVAHRARLQPRLQPRPTARKFTQIEPVSQSVSHRLVQRDQPCRLRMADRAKHVYMLHHE